MKSISIIIATYNRGQRLLGTLRSLVAQESLDPREWEVVVVNNNSTDNTTALFDDFAAAHSGLDLRMVDEDRQGLSWARNRGIGEARGEVVAIIDDDEEVNPEFAAAYVDFFRRHPEVLIAGGRIVPRYVGPDGEEVEPPSWMSRWTERPIAGTLDGGPREKPFVQGGRLFAKGGYPGGGNMAVRRLAFERWGLFDTSLGRVGAALVGGEEKELCHRIVSGSGVDAWYVPGAVIHHIISPDKLTSEYLRRLSRGVGASERIRTRALGRGRYAVAIIKEGGKWIATLLIAFFFTLTARPSKARRLVAMRTGITRGLLGD